MRAKNLALRVLSTAAMLSIVTSIAAPAFAATYYINDGSVDVKVSEAGVVTVEQGGVTYKDGLDSVVIRGGTRGETDDRVKADASPATQETDGSNAPAVNETEAPKSENTAGDTAPKQETTAAGERKEGTPQQEPTEEKEEEQEEQQEPTEEKVTPEQKPTEKEAEEKVTTELVKAKAEAPKATQKPSAEQEEEQEEQEEQQEKEDQQEEEKKSTDSSAALLAAAPAAQADNSSTSTPAAPINNVITIVNNFVNDAKQAFSFVLDNVNIDRYYTATHDISAAALTVKGDGDTEIELDGDNILKGSTNHAGLEKNDHDGTGSLTIKDDNEKAGSLTAVGGEHGAAIGGRYPSHSDSTFADTRNIKITGGTINAFGGDEAAGIGAGKYGYADNIEITGDAVVIAHGRYRGAAIGGGYGTGADITISGNATVAADAYEGAPAIGSGGNYWANGERANTTIRIKDNAKVTAIGSYGSAAIGTGYSFDYRNTGKTTIEISGGTITAVAGSNSAAIGRGNNNSANVSVTVTGDTGNTTIDAACKLDQECAIGGGKDNGDAIDSASSFGEKNGVVVRFYKNSPNAIDYLEDLKDQVLGEQYKLLHNAQWWMNNGFTSEPSTDTTHAWTVDTTKERVEPTLEHEGHVYYKCSVPGCKAVHDEVLPKLEESKPTPEPTPDPTPVQPDPTPVQPEPAPVQPDTPADTQNTAKDDVSTPKLYVIDLANTQVLFDETRQNDTVTYTTKQDGASLTGSFEALEAMAEDGVKTIVFQTIGTNTPGAVSRVSVDALLQHGGETLLLTHNGTEVHLTIDGQNVDSLLLQ